MTFDSKVNHHQRNPRQRQRWELQWHCFWVQKIDIYLIWEPMIWIWAQRTRMSMQRKTCQGGSWRWAGTAQGSLHQSWWPRRLPPGWACWKHCWSSSWSSSSWGPSFCRSRPPGRSPTQWVSSSQMMTNSSWCDFFQTVPKYFFLWSLGFVQICIKYFSVFILGFVGDLYKNVCETSLIAQFLKAAIMIMGGSINKRMGGEMGRRDCLPWLATFDLSWSSHQYEYTYFGENYWTVEFALVKK